jgi:hypothetical protein
MPPKKRRQQQLAKSLEKAREAKRRRTEAGSEAPTTETATRTIADNEGEPSGLTQLLAMSDDALDTEDEEKDPTFDLDSSLKEDKDHITDAFCEDWATHLDRDDRVSLGIFLYFQLLKVLSMGEVKAAEVAGMMIGKSERIIREWRSHFLENGEIPECKQGMYERSGVLWTNEELNKTAGDNIRSNANVKGKPNLTVGQFCHWVNNDLLWNLGFPERFLLKYHANGCMS